MRPSFSYDPRDHSDDCPFLLVSGEDGKVLQWLTRSDARLLRKEIERAEQEDAERSMCEGNSHHFVIAAAQPMLPPGEVAVECLNCPLSGAINMRGAFALVEGTEVLG